MADYHTVYKAPEGETTEWEVLQQKYGNRPAPPPTWKPEGFRAAQVRWRTRSRDARLAALAARIRWALPWRIDPPSPPSVTLCETRATHPRALAPAPAPAEPPRTAAPRFSLSR